MKGSAKPKNQTFSSLKDLPAWGTSEAPPKEMLLFPYGPTEATMWGGQRDTVYLTPDNAKKIVEEWKRRNIKGAFDYDHSVLKDNPEGTPAAGWFDVECREDGLWLTEISWTPKMMERFKNKEMRYTSPYFQTQEGEDGKHYVTDLLNVAVTNWPATDNLRPLIALKANQPNKPLKRALGVYNMDPKTQDAIKAILTKVQSDGEEADIAQALLDIQAALMGAGASGDSPADPGAADIAATAKALTGKSKPAEVKGALQAAFDAKSQTGDLLKRIQALESEKAQKMIDESKLTPAQKTWAQAQLGKPEGFDTVKSFIEASAKDAPAGPHAPLVQPPAAPAPSELTEPTKDMIAFCQEKGLDAKIYLKNWNLLNKGKTWSRSIA